MASMYDLLYRLRVTPWETAARFQQATLERVLAREEAEHPGRGVALDVGCGTGVHTLTLARRGWSAWGVDASEPAISRARQRAAGAGVAAELGKAGGSVRFDGAELRRLTDVPDLPGPVRLVVDVGCLHGIPPADRRGVADRITDLTAHDATMIVVAIDREPTRAPVGLSARGVHEMFPQWALLASEPLRLTGMRGLLGRAPFVVHRLRRA